MRFVKPLDEALIVRLAAEHDYLVTIEENAVQGGAGSAVLEVLAKHEICKPVLVLGVPDQVTEHGDPQAADGRFGLEQRDRVGADSALAGGIAIRQTQAV